MSSVTLPSGRIAVSACLLVLLAVGESHAEGLDAQSFKPATSRTGFFTVDGPLVLRHLSPSVGLTFDYGKDLLVAREPLTNDVVPGGRLVDSRLSGHLTIAMGLWERAEIGLRLPMVVYQTGSLEGIGRTDSPSSTVMGDMSVGGKVRLLGPSGRGSGFRLAASLLASIPTGSDRDFAGSGTLAVQPGVIAGFELGPFSGALNLAYWLSGESQLAGLRVNDQVVGGLAGSWAVVRERLWVLAEVWGRQGVQGDTGQNGMPIELDGGLRLTIWGPWMAQVGVGTGLSQGYGTPKLRGIAAFSYALGDSGSPPTGAPAQVATAPAGDTDGDGIRDDRDRCPKQPEDLDGFMDEDGCPDLDNDNDGIPDARDACPNAPEDMDGFQDSDGCPDEDNDADGVPDAQDACPFVPEDPDGFEDQDGCPDLDNDADGNPDTRDKCPNQPETFNGNADDDGCPDAGKVLVELTKEKLVIKQGVKFQTGRAKVKSDSFQLLATVAKLLVLHPEIRAVRVEGHTDTKGKREKNLKLSQERAEAVRNHLVGVNGIEAHRLRPVGYGPDRPVAPNDTPQGRALNRRVEFIILSQ